MADTYHTSKPPVLLAQYFNKGVYQLQWGPYEGNTDTGLYASSEGILVLFNTAKPLEGICV